MLTFDLWRPVRPDTTTEIVEVHRPHIWIFIPFRLAFWILVGSVLAALAGYRFAGDGGDPMGWFILAGASYLTFAPKWRRSVIRQRRAFCRGGRLGGVAGSSGASGSPNRP